MILNLRNSLPRFKMLQNCNVTRKKKIIAKYNSDYLIKTIVFIDIASLGAIINKKQIVIDLQKKEKKNSS